MEGQAMSLRDHPKMLPIFGQIGRMPIFQQLRFYQDVNHGRPMYGMPEPADPLDAKCNRYLHWRQCSCFEPANAHLRGLASILINQCLH